MNLKPLYDLSRSWSGTVGGDDSILTTYPSCSRELDKALEQAVASAAKPEPEYPDVPRDAYDSLLRWLECTINPSGDGGHIHPNVRGVPEWAIIRGIEKLRADASTRTSPSLRRLLIEARDRVARLCGPDAVLLGQIEEALEKEEAEDRVTQAMAEASADLTMQLNAALGEERTWRARALAAETRLGTSREYMKATTEALVALINRWRSNAPASANNEIRSMERKDCAEELHMLLVSAAVFGQVPSPVITAEQRDAPQVRHQLDSALKDVSKLKSELNMAEKFHAVAVKERDFERLTVNTLRSELAKETNERDEIDRAAKVQIALSRGQAEKVYADRMAIGEQLATVTKELADLKSVTSHNLTTWEVAVRNMVTFLVGPSGNFEIKDVVETVRILAGCDANGDPYSGERLGFIPAETVARTVLFRTQKMPGELQ